MKYDRITSYNISEVMNMNILIVPDSYKGTLTSVEVAETIKSVIEKSSDCKVIALPFADGGEGFSDAMENICNGKRLYTKCHDIYGKEIDGYITVFDKTAVVECAVASGLQQRKNVMQSTSYGTGELIHFAIENGYNNIILGLGGTGCCDGGIGALSALGVRLYNENQNIMKMPKSNDMNYIFGISTKDKVKDINFTFACDVENEFYGKNGAAYVFAPQKGARKTDVEELDAGLQRLNAFFKTDVSKVKGAGAAGGICGGLYSVFGGKIKSGFDIFSKYSNLEEKIANADIVISGEGKTDEQTLMGKLPYKISELCKKHGKKCVVISGSADDVKIGDLLLTLVDENTTLEEALAHPTEVLAKKVENNLEIILK